MTNDVGDKWKVLFPIYPHERTLKTYKAKDVKLNSNVLFEDIESENSIRHNFKRKRMQESTSFSIVGENWEIDSRLDSILTLFIDEVKLEMGAYADSCSYILSMDNYTIDNESNCFTLVQTYPDKSHFKKHNTPLYLPYKNVGILLYTGIERLFCSDMENFTLPSLSHEQYTNHGKTWSFEITPNTIRVYKEPLGEGVILGELDWALYNIERINSKKRWIDF